MKLLLLGKGGQVGWELQRSLAPLGELVALDFDSTDLHADFSRPDELAETVRKVRPRVIVNAAAHTAVDKAESEPDLARKLNANAPGVVLGTTEPIPLTGSPTHTPSPVVIAIVPSGAGEGKEPGSRSWRFEPSGAMRNTRPVRSCVKK